LQTAIGRKRFGHGYGISSMESISMAEPVY
jgi:hypothetical protein